MIYYISKLIQMSDAAKGNSVNGKTRVKVDFTQSIDANCPKCSDAQCNPVGRVGIYRKRIYIYRACKVTAILEILRALLA
jgi:hypothetical protein